MSEAPLLPAKPPTLILTDDQVIAAVKLHYGIPQDMRVIGEAALNLRPLCQQAIPLSGGYCLVFDNDEQMAEFRLRYVTAAKPKERDDDWSSIVQWSQSCGITMADIQQQILQQAQADLGKFAPKDEGK